MAGPYSPADPRNYVGLFKQSVLGTGGVPTVWLPFIGSADLDHGIEVNSILEAGGGGAVTDAEKVSHLPSIKLGFTGRPSMLGRLYAYLLGVDTISGAAVPYQHVATRDFDTDYLSAEHNLADDAIERFIDSAVIEVQITCDVENPKLRGSVNLVLGKASWQGAATAESYEIERPFLITDGAFTVDGSVVTNLRKFTYTGRIKVSRERVTKVTHEYIVKVGEEAEVEIEQFEPTNMNDYRKVAYGTITGTEPDVAPTAGAFIADFNYGATTTLRQFKIEIPTLDYHEAKYTPLSPDASEGVRVTRMGVARNDRTNPVQRITAKVPDALAWV